MLKQEMQDVLEKNILRFWLDKMQDHENGGFYGRIDGQGVLHPEAEKGAILNARILWSFSAAYRVLGNPEYLEAATRAKDYLIEHDDSRKDDEEFIRDRAEYAASVHEGEARDGTIAPREVAIKVLMEGLD